MTTVETDQRAFDKILRRNVTTPLLTGLVSSLVFIAITVWLLGNLRAVERSHEVITHSAELGRLVAESENGVRGYVVTGEARFMDTYDLAQPRFAAELQALRSLAGGDVLRSQRLRQVEALYAQWVASFAKHTIDLRKRDPAAATQYVLEGHGKRLTDAMRSELAGLVQEEQRSLTERNDSASAMALGLSIAFVALLLGFKGMLVYFGRRDLMSLSTQYRDALQRQAEHADYLQAQATLRDAQNELARVLSEHTDIRGSATAALQFVAHHLGAVVGAIYAMAEDASARRVAGFGLAPEFDSKRELVPAHQTLVGEVASARRTMTLSPAPSGLLQLSSAVAEGATASVVIVPAIHEERVIAVLEVGLLREATARDAEMLLQLAPFIASAMRAGAAREREHELLHETQQLNEEMQVQQEELRTANEELEEQSRALKESQATLESQQAELEQTNLQLSELARRLEQQRDELRGTQSALEQRAADLQRASQYKSEFLANMSHELRTPLNSSLILAKLLADNAKGNLDAEQVRFANSIYSAGNDLLSLINDILDIAKVEAGKLEVRPERTDIRSVAAAMQSMFEPVASRKRLALEVLVAPDAPAQVVTDPQRLEQILRNLLANAVKFTDRGSVSLHVVRAPSGIAFEVRDTGIGIDASQHELIFEAFRQADGTTSRRHGGTGLGLSISRDLARLLGGDITLRSEPGQGSVFTLTLPLESVPVARAPAPTPPPASARMNTPPPASQAARAPLTAPPPFADDRDREAGDSRTVLVVEDDVRFAEILFGLARELGYRCLVAHRAEEGWELAQKHVPDGVLLDMQLPDDTGLSVLQRLKEDPRTRHIPVHVISVNDYSETALQMGAVGYAFKPTTREQLREIFGRVEKKLSQKLKRVLLVEDDPRQQESVAHLIADSDVQIIAVSSGTEALHALANGVFDCMVTDLALPDMTGQELLRRMASGESRSFPPVIVYTGRNLTRDEEAELLRYSRSIIIKGARSPERLLDEVTLFLHKVESNLSSERQLMLRTARSRDRALEGRRIMVVDDDVRNIFALTSALEHKGAQVLTARNGREAIDKLSRDDAIDVVLMDLMMPEMDGYAAMREIRSNPAWKRLPIIAVTAKAMKEDQQKCIAAGANDYLAKPIDLDRLFSLIRVWMPKLERL